MSGDLHSSAVYLTFYRTVSLEVTEALHYRVLQPCNSSSRWVHPSYKLEPHPLIVYIYRPVICGLQFNHLSAESFSSNPITTMNQTTGRDTGLQDRVDENPQFE